MLYGQILRSYLRVLRIHLKTLIFRDKKIPAKSYSIDKNISLVLLQ